MAELGLPRVKSTWAWVWDDLHGTCNLLAALVGLEEACNSERGGGGGSARRNMPAVTCAGSSGHENGCERVCVRVQGQSNTKRGRCNAVQGCRGKAAEEQRRQSDGSGVPATRAVYGPLHLAQQEGQGR